MRKIYFLIAHFIFLFPSFYLEGRTNEYIPAEYVVIAQRIRAEMAGKLSKRHGMSLFGVGGGLANRVNILGLSFQIKGPVEKSRLREILIDCTEEFLHEININEKLRPT